MTVRGAEIRCERRPFGPDVTASHVPGTVRTISPPLAEDPWSAGHAPDRLRATNGPIQDIRDYWSVGRKYYDPAGIRVPVLLVHGEWDVDVPIHLAQAFFLELSHAPYRQWVEIGEATHLVLLEKNRLLAFEAVRDFYQRHFAPETTR